MTIFAAQIERLKHNYQLPNQNKITMKKVLFVSLAMAVAMTGFAQRVNVSTAMKNASATAQKPSELRIADGSQAQGMQFNMPQHMVQTSNRNRGYEEEMTMYTNYDLQSNSALGNRMASWADGTVAITATWDPSGVSSFPDRGTGYNFYDGGFSDFPEVRQEPMKSGWPSIAACGEGEVLASHATGVNLYYRPTKGQGDWELIYNWGNDFGAPTWPRVVCSGPNDEYIHIVMCKQISMPDGSLDNHIYYVRVKHENGNWDIPAEMNDFPGINNDLDGDYRNQLSADDYVLAANGNNVACMFSAYTTEVFYMISHDNGETWERQIIAPFPILGADGQPVHAIAFDDYPDGMTDSIHTSDNSHSIAIDDNGVVHAVFGLFHWKVADADSYTYWPAYGYGILYWNSNYTNELGGNQILPFGQSAVDAAHTEWMDNGIGYTLIPERIEEIAAQDGQDANLHVFGWIDDNNNGTYGEYDNVTGASWHYRSLGACTMPAIAVDGMGNLGIAWSVWSEARICGETNFPYRSAFVTLRDYTGTWFDNAYNLSTGFDHELSEVYPTFAATRAYNGEFWFGYSEDDHQGLYLDISDTYPSSNGGDMTENIIWAVKVVPSPEDPGLETWAVEEHNAINPMTTTRVYPNPATDVLNLEVNASQSSEMSVSVFNLMGQKVMEQQVNLNTGINTTNISTSDLSSGIYFVTVKANGYENTMKFVVK